MKDINEIFKEMLEKEEKENNNDSYFWILLILFLTLFNNYEKEQPTINIYVGDE